MPKWRRESEYGTGPRVPLCRELRAQFKAKLHLARRPGRLTLAAEKIGRVLVDMLGLDGRLDPSIDTLAARASVDPSTVTRALARLRELGFVAWTRRLVRDGWRVEQTSNAYRLTVPACDVHFAREAHSSVILRGVTKKARNPAPLSVEQMDAESREGRDRQLRALALL